MRPHRVHDWPTLIFAGPSTTQQGIEILRNAGVGIRPPASRGQLENAAREYGGKVNLILVDGVFYGTMSVSLMEIRKTLHSGAKVLGASSMGALRAVECSNIGMIGFGRVYRWLRLFKVEDDDEVAQLLSEDGLQAMSQPMVDIRALVALLARQGHLNPLEKSAILRQIKSKFFAERSYADVLALLPQRVIESESEIKNVRAKIKNFCGPKTMDFLELANLIRRDA